MESLALFFHFMVVELCSIVDDQGPYDSKSVNDIFPYERDVCQSFYLYLFSEVIDSY
jgi:hypothetical protein